MKTKILAAAVLASSLAPSAFAADTILFDPDGTGGLGSVQIGGLDWSAGSSLSDDSIRTENTTFDTYSHASLAGILTPLGKPGAAVPGLNGDYGDETGTTGFEITFKSGFTETVTGFTQTTAVLKTDNGGVADVYTFDQTITLSEAADQNVNFFKVYYDDLTDGLANGVKSDPLAGTGYDDGLLILDANVVAVDGNFTTHFEFIELGGTPGVYDYGIDELVSVNLDQSADGDDWADQQSVVGEGATALVADVFYQDPNFFLSDISSLVADLFFNTSNVLAFRETNPSMLFDEAGTGTITPSLGLVNGDNGPDILFQTDANNSFVTTVPEPGSMLLLGMGLFSLGMSKRRKVKDLSVA